MKWLCVPLLLACVPAYATKPALVELGQLFSAADSVVVVSVDTRRAVSATFPECGTSYGAKVEESFKGQLTGVIEFGYPDGIRVGERYVLFLSKPGVPWVALMSTNSFSEKTMAERWERCSPLQHGQRVMQGSVGALPLRGGGPFAPKVGVKIGLGLILPQELRATRDSHDSSVKWVRESDLRALLHGLAQRT